MTGEGVTGPDWRCVAGGTTTSGIYEGETFDARLRLPGWSNPIFDELLAPEQRFTRWDPNSLAERIGGMAAMSAAERAELGARLREGVAESHSVQSWARGILDAAGIA